MNNLKVRREELNLTQKEMAEKLGVTYQAYAHYESGRCEPSLGTVYQMAKIWNCSCDEIIEAILCQSSRK